MHSVYNGPQEPMPVKMPAPKRKCVRTTMFVDANLMNDFSTGCSATGIIHMLNQTPIDWFSKRQIREWSCKQQA